MLFRSTTTRTTVDRASVKTNRLVIVGDPYAYEVEDSIKRGGPTQGSEGAGYQLGRILANRKHGCRFIVGEDIKYSQEKDKLVVLDPDGKECRLDIVRQERVQH